MHITYKLFLIGSIIFANGCSTTMAPRGWKKQEVKYVCQTKPIAEPSADISFKPFKKTKSKTESKKVFVFKKVIQPTTSSSYKTFRNNTNVRKSFKVYKDSTLLKRANAKNTKLTIDISEQRVKLYVNNTVALDAPCTTGAKRKFEPNTKIYRDKRTPKGRFKITEKLRDKRSTIFGDYYRGKKKVYHGDKRKFKGSKKGLRYKGASLKNWMRLTSSGIGLHASKYVKRNPGTNGCIRLQGHVAKTIFSKVRRGTAVTIQN